jgi:hypothetical protein
MRRLVVCAALLLLSSGAIAQSQGNPPADRQDQRGNAPPPGYQDQQDNVPPPGYQGGPDNGPPPGYENGPDNGPPPGYQDQQDNAPPPGYQNGPDNGAPPAYQDQQRYDPQDQDNVPPGANDRGPQANGRAPNPDQRNGGDRRAVDGFGGWVLVTSDANWQAKWETPSSTMPTFTVARDVARGKKVFALIFFANPQLDRAKQANVTCDIEMTRPDGSVSTRQSDQVCFSGALQGDPHDTYLSVPVIGFVGDPGDPAGTWRIRVTLKDNNRHVSVPLQTSFNLRK